MFCLRTFFISKRKPSFLINKRHTSVVTDIHDFDEVPSPRGLPLIGTTLSLIAAGSSPKLHEYVDKRHKQLGQIYKESIGPVKAVFIADPEDMRTVFAHEGKYPVHVLPEAWVVYNQLYGCSRGLFFMDGEEWLHFRKILNRNLLKGDLKWINDACEVVSDMMIERFNMVCKREIIFPDLEQELYVWSIHVVIATLLGAEAYKESYMRIRMLVQALASKVHLIFQTTSKLQLFPANLAAKFNIPQWKRFVASVKNGLDTSNLLVNMLLDRCPQDDGLLKRMKDGNIDRKDITRIVADLVLAAGDTTAYSMEWMLYCVTKNKNVQKQLRETQDRSGLLKNILKETLRLYPVAPFLTRIIPEECIVGGYRIPARTLLILSIYTSGRDARYFTNPEDFLPDRWIRTEMGTANRSLMQHASLPFAIGSRSCIGRKIAETHLQMALGKIVDNFTLEICNERNIDIVLKMIVAPSEPLKLKFRKIST